MHFTTRAHLAAQQCMQLASTQIFKPPLRSRVAWIQLLFVHYLRISAGEYGGVRSKKLLKMYVKRQINSSSSSECMCLIYDLLNNFSENDKRKNP